MKYQEMIEKEAAGLAGVWDAAKGVGTAIKDTGFYKTLTGEGVQKAEGLAKNIATRAANTAGQTEAGAKVLQDAAAKAQQGVQAAKLNRGLAIGGTAAVGLGVPTMAGYTMGRASRQNKVAAERLNRYIYEAELAKESAIQAYAEAESIEKAASELAEELGFAK